MENLSCPIREVPLSLPSLPLLIPVLPSCPVGVFACFSLQWEEMEHRDTGWPQPPWFGVGGCQEQPDGAGY